MHPAVINEELFAVLERNLSSSSPIRLPDTLTESCMCVFVDLLFMFRLRERQLQYGSDQQNGAPTCLQNARRLSQRNEIKDRKTGQKALLPGGPLGNRYVPAE